MYLLFLLVLSKDPTISMTILRGSWRVGYYHRLFLLILVFSVDIVSIVEYIMEHRILDSPSNSYILFYDIFL